MGVLLAVELVFTLAFPLSLKWLIDFALTPRDGRMLGLILGGLLGALVVASLASLARDYLYAFLSAGIVRDVRVRLFEHLQRLSLDFYARTRLGDLVGRFSTDLAALENLVATTLPVMLLSSVTMLFSVALLFTLEWRLALLTVLGLSLCLVMPRGLARRAAAVSYELKQREGAIASAVLENLGAQPVIKALGLQHPAVAAFRRQTAELARVTLRFNFLSYLVERTPNIAILGFQILVVCAGAFLVFHDRLTLGSLVAFHALFLNVSSSVESLTTVAPGLLRAVGGLRRIDEVLGETPRVSDASGAPAVPRLAREIALRDVHFAYAGEQTSLADVSLTIPRGRFVALVGPSGSGKSTVLNLLMRFYDADGGSVTFDGRDVREVAQDSLRAQFGVVFQDNVLFDTSVRENIRLGKPDATDAEILAAAEAAEVHRFVADLPGGYDAPVGERGGHLSGGQRQRVAIARAVVRQPEILILDEATSALDPATEAAVSATLARIARGRTVIAVTHRLSSVVRADQIFVLEGGRLVEEGTHADLLRRRGTYAGLWAKQSGFSVSLAGDQAEVDLARLRQFPIMETLDEPLLAELAGLFVTEVYPDNRTVIREGDPGDRFYIVVHGRAEVLTQNGAGRAARIRVLDDGDHFGEIALLKNVPRTATVRTITPCVFLSLQRQHFQRLLDRAPEMRLSLERSTASRLREQV